MPLLDSFKVDHKKITAPSVRLAKTMKTPKGDTISVFDLRFCVPNQDIMSEKGIHTLEHLFAGYMRDRLENKTISIIDISPMGCRTGFYMSVIGEPTPEMVATAWNTSMIDVLHKATVIPEANELQCGTYKMHSIEEAKDIAYQVTKKEIKIINSKDIELNFERINDGSEN